MLQFSALMTVSPTIAQRSLISRISIGVMYVAISLCLIVVAYTTLTSQPGGYSEDKIGTALFYGFLIYGVAFPSGLAGLIAGIVVLARERKRRSIHAWMALLFMAVESVIFVLYILPLFAPVE
jgi:hypothetical protein